MLRLQVTDTSCSGCRVCCLWDQVQGKHCRLSVRWPAVDRGLHSHPYGYRACTHVRTHTRMCRLCRRLLWMRHAGGYWSADRHEVLGTSNTSSLLYVFFRCRHVLSGTACSVGKRDSTGSRLRSGIRLCTVFLTAHFAQNLTMATSTCGFYNITITSSTKGVQLGKSLKLQQKKLWVVCTTDR